MRRPTKPFLVEVKRNTGRARGASQASPPIDLGLSDQPFYEEVIPLRDSRFRDAESMFRNGAELAAVPPAVPPAEFEPAVIEPAVSEKASPGSGRILIDLVAEAAQSIPVPPEAPRRRGRPRKDRTIDAAAPKAKRGRPKGSKNVKPAKGKSSAVQAAIQAEPATMLSAAAPATTAFPEPAFEAIEMSSRQRRREIAASQLPRGQRWKRRLPQVCW